MRTLIRKVSCRASLILLSVLVWNTAFAADLSKHKLLVASDIHFNPMADASLIPQLIAAEPAQWEAILNKTAPRSFSPYGQDTNWWLLQSSLDEMRKTMAHPAVFFVLGDMLAHHFPEMFRESTHSEDHQQYRAFVRKTIQFLGLELRKRWPDTQILLTPGNNDNDCGNYSIEAGGTFLSDTADTLRELAKADPQAVADWKALGSYTVAHQAIPGVKIISVNSIFFSEKYEALSFRQSCEEVQTTAPSQAFAWLEQTLSDAKQSKQKVWLMFHIPPGIDGYGSVHNHEGSCVADIVPMWVPEWTVKFDSLLLNYQETIAATFAGHTHTDDFRVIRDGDVAKAFVLVNPPISPVYDHNPAFRVFDVRGADVRDQTTYYLSNLINASGEKPGKWKKEYTFSRKWKTKHLDATAMGKIYDGIASDEKTRTKWLKLYNVSSNVAKVKPDEVRGLYCAIEGLGVGAYGNCACATAK